MKGRFDIIIRGRMNWVLIFFCAALVILLTKLFITQIVDYRVYLDLSSKQHRLVKEIFSERGSIYAHDKKGDLQPLALNKIQKNLSASPKDIKDPESVAEFIAQETGLDKDKILQKISNINDSYEILIKDLGDDIVSKIESKNIKGLFLEEEKKRVYPNQTIGAHILGFVSKDKDVEVGKYGLEGLFEKELSGQAGIFEGAKDAGGSWIALGRRIVNPPKDGSNLTLTIDFNIQNKAEQLLNDARNQWKASSGSVLVLEPSTGKILAMAAVPSFNPNEFFKEKDYKVFINPLVQNMYELGSVMKPITMASALNEKLITPDSTYYDTGVATFGTYKINNSDGKGYEQQTMTQVLEKSLNTGAVYVSKLLGKDKQFEYLKKFGFGSKEGIDLPGEVAGDIANLDAKRDVDFATASFGQGIAVTPIQLASAMAAIANGGNLMKPYIVEKKIDSSGNETVFNPEIIRNVISKESADSLTKMLVSVVRKGYDNRAGVKGYFVAGKTGTAQIPSKDHRGYSEDAIHSFIGYAPAFNPKFLIFIQLDKPQAKFASTTLPPYFKELSSFILNYYQIPPDEK